MSRKTYDAGLSALWTTQNFLTSGRLIRRLLGKTSITGEDTVIEIGPGKGHSTRALLDVCGKLIAVEIDPRLVSALREKLGGHGRLTLIQADFLTWRLPGRGPYKVYANLPFNRTTAIMNKLSAARNPPEEAWLVMARGAAMRFMGKPRENLRSLLLKPRFDLSIVHHFSREDFHPRPSVDAVMVRMRRKDAPDIQPEQWQPYQRFVSDCLSAGSVRRYLTGRQAAAALRESGPVDIRSGTMLYVQWLCLFRWWYRLWMKE